MDMDDPALTRWLAAVRAIHFASCLLIGGVWTFDVLLTGLALPRWRRLAIYLLAIATPAALLSGAAWFVLVAADMSGLDVRAAMHADVLRTAWSQTRFGAAWQVHTLFWLAGAIVAAAWAATQRGRWLGLMMAGGLVGGLAWSGHGNTGPAPNWHRAADVLHLLAAAVWPAGLAPLALLLRKTSRSDDPNRWPTLSRLTWRFSAASLIAVAALTATGLVNSWCLVGSIDGLLNTPYGHVLIVKLVLFATMIALGALNLLVLKPRMAHSGPSTARRLWCSVSVEAALGTAVVIAVGLLGFLEPARM